MSHIVVIGSGLAGYSFIREFRKHDTTSAITLVCADSGDYYSKPDLSAALSRHKTPDELVISRATDMSAQYAFTLLTHTTVETIDRHHKILSTTAGNITYDSLVLALGATSKSLPPALTGALTRPLHTVNSLTEYRAFIADVLQHPSQSVSIIGSGLIACEFANDLITITKNIKIFSIAPYALSGLIPEPIAMQLQATLEAQSVQWHANLNPEDLFEQIPEKDVLLCAIGLTPNTALAKNAGLDVAQGILTNEFGKTSDDSIYCLGDCAQIQGLWLPYIMPITSAARSLGKTLAGEPTAIHYPTMPIMVKTSLYPLSIVPPKPGDSTTWVVEPVEGDLIATGNENGKTNAYVLTGKHSRTAIIKARSLGDWIAP